tara:strand:+ start:560 stop:952 length:393 start_codon:yes stop_codon:yes gene_type:complete
MFSKKQKNDKRQLLEQEISNYKSQMITLSQEIQQLRQYIDFQNLEFQKILDNKELEISYLRTENKIIKDKQMDTILDEYLCKICMDNPINCILEPCMHFCICQDCVEILTDKKCPICRVECNFYNKVFIS